MGGLDGLWINIIASSFMGQIGYLLEFIRHQYQRQGEEIERGEKADRMGSSDL